MNEDPAFTRVRARRALADLERDLGPGVAAALARTASLLRDDADHLDDLADAAVAALGPQPWPVEALTGIPRAVRTRVWRRLLVAAGAPGRPGRHPAHRRLRPAAHRAGTGRARCTPPATCASPDPAVGSPSPPAIGLTRHHHPPAPHPPGAAVDAAHMGADLERVLITEEQIQAKLAELAGEIAQDYAGKDLLLVGVLKGAVMVMADLMRALPVTVPVDWMAVSSYGSGTKSSGVVRILKDLDTDITGRHVLIVEDIVDSGPDPVVDQVQPRVAQPGLGRDLHAAAQAGCREGRGRRQVRRLRHPERVRRRLRPRLRRELPQPARGRHPRPARLQLTRGAGRAEPPSCRGTRGRRGSLLACTRSTRCDLRAAD